MITIVGGGVGALTLAYDLVGRGVAVRVLESRGRPGGLIASTELDGLTFDIGAESWARRDAFVSDLAAELGLTEILPGGGSWVYTARGPIQNAPGAILGIPGDVAALEGRLSPEGFEAAMADVRVPVAVGNADELPATLAELVESRMGREVLDDLVAPIAGGIHSTDPKNLDADTVIPGLRAAVVREGSLSGAVRALLALRPAGGPIASIDGGMFRFTDTLAERVLAGGGEILTRAAVASVARADAGWTLTLTDGRTLESDVVVLGADDATNLSLLAPLLPHDIELPPAASILHWTLVVESPELDAAPRGTGLLVQAGTPGVRAKALTHLSQKWGWLAPGDSRHVLRVSYGRAGEDCSDVDEAVAMADAETLLGVPLTLRASRKINWGGALTPRTPKNRADMRALAVRMQEIGLRGVGAWAAGTGISAVVEHARKLAAELADAAGADSEADLDREAGDAVVGEKSANSLAVGTRTSMLALTQSKATAALVADALGYDGFHVHPVTTEGDVNMAPLASLSGTGVFVTALREELLAGRCDIAVHSAKDLPSADVPGLSYWTPKRVDSADVLCARGKTLAELPEGARIGTGSPRRAAQLRAIRPDLEIVAIRGNVPTRLGREDLDGVVLARAGLERLGLLDAISDELDILPAACQGILAVESATLDLAPIDHLPTHIEAVAERKVMNALGAGCTTPIGVRAVAEVDADGMPVGLSIRARLLTPDGSLVVEDAVDLDSVSVGGVSLDDARELGADLAQRLAANPLTDQILRSAQ